MSGVQMNMIGYLGAKHGGAVRGMDADDQFLYTCGEDGVVFRFDSASGFQHEVFYPMKQQDQAPVPLTALKLSWSREGPVLLLGDSTGKVKILNAMQRNGLGTIAFFQNAQVQAFSTYVANGVFAVLGDSTIFVMQWK